MPPAHSIASDFVMPTSIAAAIPLVNRHSDTASLDHLRMADVGNRVRTLRKMQGLTQVRLAKLVGVSQGAVSDIERGDTSVMMGPTLTAICRALATNPDWLLSGRGSPAPSPPASPDGSELLTIYAQLPDAQREALLTVARSMRDGLGSRATAENPFPAARRGA